MHKLLFIDNDTNLLNINRTYFTAHGFAVDTAASFPDALTLLEHTTYDCIIMEVCIDDADGFAFSRQQKAKDCVPSFYRAFVHNRLPRCEKLSQGNGRH